MKANHVPDAADIQRMFAGVPGGGTVQPASVVSSQGVTYALAGGAGGERLLVHGPAGTSWLEALRVVAAADPALFRRLYALALERYANARKLYHVTPDLVALPKPGGLGPAECRALLDDTNARRVLHITYGEMLAVPELKAALFSLLDARADEYAVALEKHIGRHLSLLGIGPREA